jgi:hypothetical protein
MPVRGRPNARGRRHLRSLARVGLSLLLAGCRQSGTPAGTERVLPARGALVVVEGSAGEFFEARVLSSEQARLRVQRPDAENALSVPLADAYLVPGQASPTPQAFAICEQAAARWVGCRVDSVADGTIHATTADGAELSARAERVLAASSFTASNIQHRFERQAELAGFARQAAQAGEPQRDPSYRAAAHERVVARIGAQWFTAYVVEIDDDGLVVSLSERSRREKVPASAVIPDPPYPLDLHRGQFVLLRPNTQSEPWPRRMVRSYEGGELKLVDAAGTSIVASVREVIPLVAR